MEAGLKTKTDTGILQLDSNYENYSLLKKVRGTCVGNIIFSFNYGYLDITVISENPIFVAVKGTYIGQKLILYYVSKNNNQYTMRVMATKNTEVEVYIYSRAPSFKSKNGLNIYTENGDIAFSSEVPYLWLDNIVNVSPSNSGGQIIRSLNNNDQLAICMPPLTSSLASSPSIDIGGFTYFPFQANPLVYNGDYYQITTNRENIFFEGNGFPVADNYYIFGSFALVDVRNTASFNWEQA